MHPLTPAWRPIVDAVRTHPGAALHEIADATGLAASTALRHLTALADAGWLERRGARQHARYFPKETLFVEWLGRPQPTDAWMIQEWQSTGTVDWRFPLLTRIPDLRARQTVLRFLQEAWDRGLFTPWLLSADDSNASQKKRTRRALFYQQLRARERRHGFLVAVYGSCARGDAQEGSDVDLLLLGPAEPISHEDEVPYLHELGFAGLAAEISLGSPRAISLAAWTADELRDLPSVLFRDEVLRDAVTVYSSTGNLFVETLAGSGDV